MGGSHRYCIEMKLFQDVINKARKQLAAQNAGYTPPYHWDRHAKPRGAAQDVVCEDAKDSKGDSLGHPKLRCVIALVRALPTSPLSLSFQKSIFSQILFL